VFWFETSESSYSSLKAINNGEPLVRLGLLILKMVLESCWSQDSPIIQNAAGQQQSNGSYPNQIMKGAFQIMEQLLGN